MLCTICGSDEAVDEVSGCQKCVARYGWVLVKAAYDEFDYAVGLLTGEVVRFSSAEINGRWITLKGQAESNGGPPPWYDMPVTGLKYPCMRGVCIKLDSILWAADAPQGS
jgi:hypothetical protein